MTNATEESLPKFKCACYPRFSCSFGNDFCLTDTKVRDVSSLKASPLCCSVVLYNIMFSCKSSLLCDNAMFYKVTHVCYTYSTLPRICERDGGNEHISIFN